MLPLRHEEPFTPFAAWLADAVASEPDVPDAMQVATVGPDGRPSLRTVLLKGHGPEGFVFYTNLGSRKAVQLTETGHAALLLHWKSLQRQVIAEGPAEPVTDAEADAYWATRPRGSQLGAWASRQSAPLEGRDQLLARVEEVRRRFPEGAPLPRPPFWGGFRVRPLRVEFWQGLPDRLHDRCVFERPTPDAPWTRRRLNP